MCQIVCQVCSKQISDDDNVYQVRLGFVETGEYTPESEVAYYHSECCPINNPIEDK